MSFASPALSLASPTLCLHLRRKLRHTLPQRHISGLYLFKLCKSSREFRRKKFFDAFLLVARKFNTGDLLDCLCNFMSNSPGLRIVRCRTFLGHARAPSSFFWHEHAAAPRAGRAGQASRRCGRDATVRRPAPRRLLYHDRHLRRAQRTHFLVDNSPLPTAHRKAKPDFRPRSNMRPVLRWIARGDNSRQNLYGARGSTAGPCLRTERGSHEHKEP